MIGLVKVSDVLAASDGVKPPATIDVNDEAAEAYWAYRFNISPADLVAAIQEVRSSVAAVRRHLNK